MGRFESRTVLRASQLNEAFDSAADEAHLAAAAPKAEGLFRPWWCDGPVNTIRLSGDRIEVETLYANMPHGRPVHVEKASIESRSRASPFSTRTAR